MHVRCPHCHNPIELVDDAEFSDIECRRAAAWEESRGRGRCQVDTKKSVGFPADLSLEDNGVCDFGFAQGIVGHGSVRSLVSFIPLESFLLRRGHSFNPMEHFI